MTFARPILILLAALLAVFAETQLNLPERLLAVRIHLLPAVVVYAALRSGLGMLTLTAVANNPNTCPKRISALY